MAFFKIGNTDFSTYISGLKCGFETLLADNSGRNANGNTVIDIINHKDKIYITTKPLTDTQMAAFLSAINDFTVHISYMNPRTNTLKTNVHCYAGTPEPEFYRIINGKILYKPMNINFIEL